MCVRFPCVGYLYSTSWCAAVRSELSVLINRDVAQQVSSIIACCQCLWVCSPLDNATWESWRRKRRGARLPSSDCQEIPRWRRMWGTKSSRGAALSLPFESRRREHITLHCTCHVRCSVNASRQFQHEGSLMFSEQELQLLRDLFIQGVGSYFETAPQLDTIFLYWFNRILSFNPLIICSVKCQSTAITIPQSASWCLYRSCLVWPAAQCWRSDWNHLAKKTVILFWTGSTLGESNVFVSLIILPAHIVNGSIN